MGAKWFRRGSSGLWLRQGNSAGQTVIRAQSANDNIIKPVAIHIARDKRGQEIGRPERGGELGVTGGDLDDTFAISGAGHVS